MIEGLWGSDPHVTDGRNFRFIRSEDRRFGSRRCLLALSEFQMKVGAKRYRATRTGGGHFYVAGIWEPDVDGGAPYFRVITVPASPDIASFQERHGAIVPHPLVEQCLDPATPASICLSVPRAGYFRVAESSLPPRQREFAL